MTLIYTRFRAVIQSVFVMFLLGLTTYSNAQVATTYTFTQSAGTYTAITGTVLANAAMGNMDDEVFGPIAIPSFTFDGAAYTSIYVNTNGHITFGSAPSTTNYLAISSTETYPGCVAAFSEDLDQAASGTRNIRYQQVGNEFVVQWQNVGRYAVAADRISFQIRLNTATNQINIVYGGTITPDNYNFYPEVGLRGPDNTFATNVNNRRVVAATGAWINSTAGGNNTHACYFNSANPGTVPAAGTTFTWTPAPVDMQAFALVSPGLSGCYGATNTVSFSIRNSGGATINFATNPVTLTSSVAGPNAMSFPPVVINTGTLAVNATQTVVVSTTYNMTAAGIYTFSASTAVTGDSHINNNAMTVAVRESHTPAITASADVTICNGQSTPLTSTGTSFAYTATFANTTLLAIPDDTPAGVNSTIAVTGAPVLASTVTVRIDNLTHTFDGDLILRLTAPDGSTIILSNLNGGGGANFINTEFSASAVTPIATGTAPFTGAFIPDEPLTNLTGNANGTWTLNVSDNAGADVGVLQGWTLMFPIANSISTYSWAPPAGLSSTTVSNPTANPTTTTTYTVTVTDASGCAQTEPVTVTVNPLPTVTANTTASAVCTGSPVTLTGGGATSYVWTGGVTNGVAFVPVSTNTYTVTGTNANGCQNTATITITVNPLPTVTANTTASTVCSGSPVTLTGGGATSYTWTGGVTNGVAFNPVSTNTYTVTGTNGNGCQNTATITINVNPLPTLTVTTTASVVCVGTPVTLTATGATSYSWTGGVTNGVPFTPLSTNTYTVTGTDGNGCQNTSSLGITVNPLPTLTVTATSSVVCVGTPVTLTATGATTYSWTGGVTNGVPFTPLSTNTYTVTGTDGNGCQNTSSLGITVNPLPTVTANTTATAVCTGSPVTLTGGGATSYTWTGGVTNGVPFNPVSTNTYTVTGTNGNSCQNTATISVTVNPLPTVTANTTATAVCTGSPVTLTGGGATSYTWTGGVTNGVPFTPVSTNTYTVTGTNGNGCQNTATISVTVNPLPTVTANTTATAVCTGSPVTLTGGGATSYTWSGGVTNGVAFVPPSTTTYTVTGTNGNGCQNTASITITVNPLPTVTANTTATAVCTGFPVTLTGGGATSYTWSHGVTNGVPFNPPSTTTYTVTGTNGNGCQNTATITITVNPLPNVTATATPGTTVCAGTPVTLNGGGAVIYSWSHSVADGIPFVPTATTTYTVAGTNANGCQAMTPITITVNPLPTVTANTTASSVCTGSPVTLTGGGATSYTWSGGVTNGVAFVPLSTSTYTVTGTNGNGCQNTASITITVNPLPTVTASTTASSVCSGSPVTLNGGGATAYSWSGGVTDGVPFTPVATDTYTVTGTNGNGCQNTATITVTVNSLPTVIANTTATAICDGSQVTLTGSGATSYTWTGSVVDGVPFTPTVTDTYTVTGTDGNGCQDTDVITVTVGALPVVVANTTSSAVCDGSPVTLSGSGATTYTWTGGVIDGVPFTPVATDTYTVTGTNGSGCQNTDVITITVNALPTVTANTTASAVCDGSPVTLSGSGATVYTWTGSVSDGVAFTPTVTDTYTVTGTDGNGCVDTDVITVTVNALPTVVASTTASTVCSGTTVTLSGSGATTYAWTGSVTDNVPFTPTVTDTYTVTGTDGNGCVNTDVITVTVNALPLVTASATATTVCAGAPVTLSGNGATSYTWTGSVTDNVPFTPTVTDTYTVTGTDGNGCQDTDVITVNVNALPTVTLSLPLDTVCLTMGSITLSGETPAGGTWAGPGITGNSFDPTVPGVGTTAIMYVYTDTNGCSASATDSVVVDVCNGTGISAEPGMSINAYPNPSAGVVVLNISNSSNSTLQMEIVDLQGQVIYAEQLNNVTGRFTHTVDLSGYANGAYFIRLTGVDAVNMVKVIKQD